MDTRDRLSQTDTAEVLLGEPEQPLCLCVLYCPCRPNSCMQIPMVPGELVAGRCEGRKDIVLAAGQVLFPDGRVSRRHVRFSRVGATVAVQDLGSKNGTYVNGARVQAALLSFQDVVRLGDTLLLCSRLGLPLDGPELQGRGLLGISAAILEVRRAVERLGPTDLSVLITGESGTGKELVARALHEASGRKGSFVAVNSSAIPKDLAESELFGVKKGAFSGADRDRKGIIQQADGGTLFLDELGDMPLPLQSKLLRVVEQQEVVPLGTTTAERIDVRFLAATNRDVTGAAERGAFRLDLLHRLSQSTVRVPPLRERKEDILCLWDSFLKMPEGGEKVYDANAAEALLLYRWAGNVRELRNVAAEHGVSSSASSQPQNRPLPVRILDVLRRARVGAEAPCHSSAGEEALESARSPSGLSALAPDIEQAKRPTRPSREAILDSLRRHRGNLAAVAAEFGRQRPQAYRWLAHYGIDPTPFREEEST
ncbi:MAG: FHA domain-containing protein [Deltaproteobacteria bacterium]|nr:FHA domain-containing protein [Deltaproteobacteria bacterium]